MKVSKYPEKSIRFMSNFETDPLNFTKMNQIIILSLILFFFSMFLLIFKFSNVIQTYFYCILFIAKM